MAARKGRSKSRMDMRRESEAAENTDEDVEEEEEDLDESDEGDDDEIDDDDLGDSEDSEDAEDYEEHGDEDDEEAPRKKKKKVKEKKPAKARTKAAKKSAVNQRLRMVWGVFDNSAQQVATYPYTDRPDAEKRAKELTEKGRGTYFVQPVKEPIVEKSSAEAKK